MRIEERLAARGWRTAAALKSPGGAGLPHDVPVEVEAVVALHGR